MFVTSAASGRNPASDPPAPATIAVSGIIDWERARPDAPSAFDICYLAVSARALSRGEQIGQTVRDLLSAPHWNDDETKWLAATADRVSGPAGWPFHPTAIRAMVGLVWLHHVVANIEKSRLYGTSRFWAAANIDWVLREYLQYRSIPE
jgi:hypothetical protein